MGQEDVLASQQGHRSYIFDSRTRCFCRYAVCCPQYGAEGRSGVRLLAGVLPRAQHFDQDQED